MQDFAKISNIIYLAILLCALLIPVFLNKSEFAKNLKKLAIWLVVIFVLISLYSYRFEFSDFKNRVFGEIFPGKITTNKDGKLILRLARDNHFYLNAKINGENVRFMIDTGASDIVLTKVDAEKIGVNFDNLRFDKKYHTANGVILAASYNIKSMKIGEIEFFNINSSVSRANQEVSLLGMSFLRKFEKYEFYRDKLILQY